MNLVVNRRNFRITECKQTNWKHGH